MKFLTAEEIKKACEKYLAAPKEIQDQVKMFEIFAHPDTNEGRYGPLAQGFILVRFDAEEGWTGITHEDFASDFCYCEYGNKVTYGMGNFLVRSWDFKPANNKDLMVRIFLSNTNPKEEFRPLTRYVLLGVVESMDLRPIWGRLDFYRKLGWRR